MMDGIKNYQYVTVDGEIFSPDSWEEYLNKKWIEKTILNNEKKQISHASWEYINKLFSLKLKKRDAVPDLLPDGAGILAIEHTNIFFADDLVVYEPNLTERFRIKPPRVSGWSKPESAYFYYVRFINNELCECLFNDGHDEYVGTLDFLVGTISDIKKTHI